MNTELQSFLDEVEYNMLFGALQNEELSVTDEHGNKNVVVAFATEPLSALLARIANAGGYANVFVKSGRRVERLAVVMSSSALNEDSAEDMTGDERPSPDSEIGMFIEYLRMQADGIRIPSPDDDCWPLARVEHEVEFV